MKKSEPGGSDPFAAKGLNIASICYHYTHNFVKNSPDLRFADYHVEN
jgi:hypothetical protein